MFDQPNANEEHQPDVITPPAAPAGENWEARYKGMQTLYNKVNAQLTVAQRELTEAHVKVEELTQQVKSLESDKGGATSSLTVAQEKANVAEKQLAILKKKLDVVKTNPDIALFADMITIGESDEETAANVAKLNESIKRLLDGRVADRLSGSSPNLPKALDDKSKKPDVDALYDKVSELAGKPGKEKEYQATYAEYLEALKN